MHVENSDRLSYRLLSTNDATLFFELDQDPLVMKYINGGKPNSMEDIENLFMPRLTQFTDADKGWGMWGIFDKANNEFLGWILVRPMGFFSENPEWRNLEIGWRLMHKTWGKGIATEAAKAVTDALIEQQSIHFDSFCAIAMTENQASVNIMKKLGLEYIKTYMHKDAFGENKVVYYRRELQTQ